MPPKVPLPRVFPLPRILVLDCGARHVAGGLFALGAGGRLVLRQWALESHGFDATGEAGWNEAVRRTLAVIARRGKFDGVCRLALPGHHTLVKFVRTPLLERARQASVIEFAARQNIPCPLEQVVWDHWVVADDGTDLELMLAAIKNEAASAVPDAARTAGFRISQMVPSSLALLNAFRYNHPTERTGVLLAEIGARSTHLVFIEGKRFFIRTFSLGGDAVTQAVADELKIDFNAAETLKTQILAGAREVVMDSDSSAAVHRAAARFVVRLHLEIVRSTISCRRYAEATRPTTVYLSGGGSLIPELPVMLADKLAMRVVRFEPLRNITLMPPARPGSEAAAPMLASLVGLATSLIDDGWPRLNLLPPALVQEQATRRRQPVLLAAALLAAIVPLPVAWSCQRAATAAGRASAAIERRLVPLRARLARNTGNLGQIEQTKQRLNALRSLVDAKSSWIVFFNDLQERLGQAEDVWLEKFQPVAPAPGAPAAPAAAQRFVLSGWLLDRGNPLAKTVPDSHGRIRSLRQLISQSPFIAAVENEHFGRTDPGMLRFDFTIVLDPRKTL